MESKKYAGALAQTNAGACFIPEKLLTEEMPSSLAVLVCADPKTAYAKVAGNLYCERTWRRDSGEAGSGFISPGAHLDPSAEIALGVIIHAGAVIGVGAQVGSGTVIGPGAVIGDEVTIGRESYIGPNVVIQCAMVGDRVLS